jgi:hypothetical protein
MAHLSTKKVWDCLPLQGKNRLAHEGR